MHVVVVGAGLAGLSAARAAVERGAQVTVLEARRHLGGKASSWQDAAGDWVESGLHVFFGAYEHLFELMRVAGAYQNLLWQEHVLTFALPGGVRAPFAFPALPAPLNGLAAVTRTGELMRPKDKLAFLTKLLPVYLNRRGFIQAQDGQTYRDWHLQRGLTPNLLERFFAPLALALDFTPVDQISAYPVLNVCSYFASAGKNSRVAFLDGPTATRLFEPIERFLELRGGTVRRSAPVVGLQVDERGTVRGVRTAAGDAVEADAVVLATPLHRTRELLPDRLRDAAGVRGIYGLTSAPVITAHLWFDRSIVGAGNIHFSPGSRVPVFAELSRVAPAFQPAGAGCFLEAVVAPADDLITADDSEIERVVLSDLRRLFPVTTSATLLKSVYVRVPRSVYRASPGSEALRPSTQTPIRGLLLAGDYVAGPIPSSMEAAVMSGTTAGRLAAQRD